VPEIKKQWLQMRNPDNIRTSGQLHWRPLAYDNRLWIDDEAVNRHLRHIQFPFPVDITSVSAKKEKSSPPPSLPNESGSTTLSATLAQQERKEPSAWATLDEEERKGMVFLDSTQISEAVRTRLGSGKLDEAFFGEYGSRIDSEIKKQLRFLILHHYALQLRESKTLSKEFQVDALASITSIGAQTILVLAFTLIETVSIARGDFDLETFFVNIAILIPAFFLFYASAYKSFAALHDISQHEITGTPEAQSRQRLMIYVRSLFSGKNFPSTVPMPTLTIPLARSFRVKKTFIKGGTQEPLQEHPEEPQQEPPADPQ
jgi:hypothetical protein